jgi:hypothetical protein
VCGCERMRALSRRAHGKNYSSKEKMGWRNVRDERRTGTDASDGG